MSYLDVIDTLQSIADGVLFGATYSLLGIGFTLVFGVMHKINLSYAAASIGAAYASLIVLSVVKAPAIFIFLLAGLSGGIIGFVVYIVCFRFIPQANPLATLMSTVGALLLIDEIIVHATVGIPVPYPALFSDVIVNAGPFTLRGDLMFMFALGCLSMLLLLVLLYRTSSASRRARSRSSPSRRSCAESRSRASTA